MSVESITKRIISDAEHRVSEIKATAEQQRDEIKAKSAEEISMLQSEIERSAEDIGKLHEEQLLRAARSEAKIKITETKHGIIDKCFAKALQHLAELPKAEYDKIVETILARIAPQPNDVVEQVGNNGGFIVRQGNVITNYTFSFIAEVIRPQLEAEISRILWVES